jgi:hypothetical protein
MAFLHAILMSKRLLARVRKGAIVPELLLKWQTLL